jgi:hypothetical protein
MRKTYYIFIISCLALPVLAQSQGKRDSANNDRPKLNGHEFIMNRYVQDPFIYSGFRMVFGVSISEEYDLFDIPLGDTVLTVRGGNNLYAGLNAGYQQKINDWAMLYVDFGLLGRIGTEATSLISNGLSTISGSTYGMKFKLLENEKSMLSTGFEVKNYGVSSVNILQYVVDLLDNNPDASLNQNSSALFGNVSVQYAYAFSDLIGAYGTIRYTFGDSVIPGQSVQDFGYALALDINLKSRTQIPLGFNLGITSTTIPEFTLATTTNTTLANFRLVYTGRDDLQIGLNTSFYSAPFNFEAAGIPLSVETNVFGSSLSLNYFF